METENIPAYRNGKICYIEIPSNDIQVSSLFYKKVFGWEIRNDNAGNIAFDDTVGQVSGMWTTLLKPAVEPGMIISIMVDNIQETVELIKSEGGKIVKVDIESPEKIAWFTDPTGNIFGLYQQ